MKKGTRKIRILIADDHGMFRDGLSDLLNDQDDMEVVGGVGNGEECLREGKRLKPDVVLMDITMPGLSGVEATRTLKKDFPAMRVLVISAYEDELHILDAFRAGADGYMGKASEASDLFDAIRRVHTDGAIVPTALLPKLLRGVRGMADGSRDMAGSGLTETELRILDLVKRGLQNKEIGAQMDISEKTVRNHMNNVFQKLQVTGRTAAIVKAIQRGILSLE